MSEVLPIEDFLKRLRAESREGALLLDSRSPSEYRQAHIPGAVNLPLLNDEHRKEVGITYKQKGKEAAVLKGFDLVGGKFSEFIRTVKDLLKELPERTANNEQPTIFLYCWRGGMRSNIMAWVLSTAGFKISLLKGGYKEYRNYVLNKLKEERKIIILGGKTGSGKTEVLEHLRSAGEQVICLETLANHRGSAFGGLGMPEQPRHEMFENLLAEEWEKMDENKVLWLENESRTIGSVLIPEKIFESMRSAPVVELVSDKAMRIKRILDEYGKFPVEELIEKTKKIEKRLGGLETQLSIEALQEGRMNDWVDKMLSYYDKTYQFGIDTRPKESVFSVVLNENDSPEVIVIKLRSSAGKISESLLTS